MGANASALNFSVIVLILTQALNENNVFLQYITTRLQFNREFSAN